MKALQPLREAAARAAGRIDSLTLRERAILFVSALLVLVALADRLALTPLLAAQKRMKGQLETQTADLDALRAQLGNDAAAAQTPAGRLQSALRQQREQLAGLERDLADQRARRVDAVQLPDLLERLLQRHDRLTLVGLSLVQDKPVASSPATPAARLHLKGVDLAVAGSYTDLAAYLAEIERDLPGLRWGALQLSGASEPPLLSVRLQLLEGAP